jgi:hypothetical protein
LKSLQREKDLKDKADDYIYINGLLDFGEIAVKPMLEIWKDSVSGSYVNGVAAEVLGRHLALPL